MLNNTVYTESFVIAFMYVLESLITNGDVFIISITNLNGIKFGFISCIFNNCSFVGNGNITKKYTVIMYKINEYTMTVLNLFIAPYL